MIAANNVVMCFFMISLLYINVRQDAIGTPYCITVDHQTLEDNTVTIRHRDSMKQERVPADELGRIIGDLVSWNNLLSQLI